MLNDTTLLLDLDGVSVTRVERLAEGTRRVHLVTADETARACPACGVFATRVKGSAVTRPRDLPYGENGLEFRWHKRRWWCREPCCPRRSFTEQIGQIPAGARITGRLRSAAGRRVRDAASTVVQAARDLRLSWPTVEPLNPNTDYHRWKTLLEDAGVRIGRLHHARHTAGTVLLLLGVPDVVVDASWVGNQAGRLGCAPGTCT